MLKWIPHYQSGCWVMEAGSAHLEDHATKTSCHLDYPWNGKEERKLEAIPTWLGDQWTQWRIMIITMAIWNGLDKIWFRLLNECAIKLKGHQITGEGLSVVNIVNRKFGLIWWGISAPFRWNAIPAPLGARVYPWILSKYFLCIRACIHPCVCPPKDKRTVCIFCVKTLNLCGI